MGDFRRYTRPHRGKPVLLPPKVGWQGAAFTKTAEGRAHGLPKIEGRNLDPSVPDLVQCACGRVVAEDMVIAYDGRWMCDGCWTDIRRRGLWDDAKVDVEPDA